MVHTLTGQSSTHSRAVLYCTAYQLFLELVCLIRVFQLFQPLPGPLWSHQRLTLIPIQPPKVGVEVQE